MMDDVSTSAWNFATLSVQTEILSKDCNCFVLAKSPVLIVVQKTCVRMCWFKVINSTICDTKCYLCAWHEGKWRRWYTIPLILIIHYYTYFNIIFGILLVYLLTCGPGQHSGYGLDGPEIESRWGRDFLHPSVPALGPSQPSIQSVSGLSRG